MQQATEGVQHAGQGGNGAYPAGGGRAEPAGLRQRPRPRRRPPRRPPPPVRDHITEATRWEPRGIGSPGPWLPEGAVFVGELPGELAFGEEPRPDLLHESNCWGQQNPAGFLLRVDDANPQAEFLANHPDRLEQIRVVRNQDGHFVFFSESIPKQMRCQVDV